MVVTPAEVCRRLLAAMDAAEGRRRRRKRDTTPDAIGLAVKRHLLEAAVREEPAPEAFEGWLLEKSLGGGGAPEGSSGSRRSMALEILAEWRLAGRSAVFRGWLESGAPSEDAGGARLPPARSGGDETGA